MKKLMIDMDDVICDGGFLTLVNQFLNTNYKIEDVKAYYIQDLIPKERMSEWAEYFHKQNLYEHVRLLDGAYEVMENLQKNYELYILTAYIIRDDKSISGKNLLNKFNWLYKELPFIKPEQYIFADNKSIISSDIRIDDKVSNLKGECEKKLLFTAYHNKNIPETELEKENIIRVDNWKEIGKILL